MDECGAPVCQSVDLSVCRSVGQLDGPDVARCQLAARLSPPGPRGKSHGGLNKVAQQLARMFHTLSDEIPLREPPWVTGRRPHAAETVGEDEGSRGGFSDAVGRRRRSNLQSRRAGLGSSVQHGRGLEASRKQVRAHQETSAFGGRVSGLRLNMDGAELPRELQPAL